MDYDGPSVLARLRALQDALNTAKGSTDLDPFDEAVANAVGYMIELSIAQTADRARATAADKRLKRQRRLGIG